MPGSPSAAVLAPVRDVRPASVAAAASLLSTVVPSPCAGLTPYHSPAVSRFLGAAADLPPSRRTLLLREITAAELDDRPAAVADWRVLGSVLFLNGIAVTPTQRRRGHAQALLRDGVDRAGEYGCRALELEVATDNRAAISLYERFGFRAVATSTWAQVPLPATAPLPAHPTDGAWRVRNWPTYTCHRDAYGFADLELGGPNGTTVVRVLPGGWRVREPEPAAAIVAALGDVVPRPERVYTIRDDRPSRLPDDLAPLATFHRMRLLLDSG